MLFRKQKKPVPDAGEALPGRQTAIDTAEMHFVLGRPLKSDLPENHLSAFFALGCFWGAERKFWETPGIWLTAAGYMGGKTLNPTYEEVCTGQTGHAESVRVIYDPSAISYEALLRLFWESHNPTQGMRQGNDIGTQYRSAIFTTTPEQADQALASKARYQQALAAAGHEGSITTEILPAGTFYYAEDEHQQYLAKNPGGYCGLGGTGVTCA